MNEILASTTAAAQDAANDTNEDGFTVTIEHGDFGCVVVSGPAIAALTPKRRAELQAVLEADLIQVAARLRAERAFADLPDPGEPLTALINDVAGVDR